MDVKETAGFSREEKLVNGILSAAFNGVQCVVLVGLGAQGNQEHGLRSLERRWCQKTEDELLIR